MCNALEPKYSTPLVMGWVSIVMLDLVSPFKAFLKQHNYQLTSERLEIAQQVGRMRRMFTTEELIMTLQEAHCRQSRGTVYSTVHLLAEAGLIVQIPQSKEAHYMTYEQASSYAVCICRHCGAERLYRQHRRLTSLRQGGKSRWRALQPVLIYYGICQHCGESAIKQRSNKRTMSQ